MGRSPVSGDRLSIVGPAIAGILAGLLGGALLVSWAGPLWIRIGVGLVLLAFVAMPKGARLAAAAAFLLTLGAVGLATLALFAERPDPATAVAAGVSVVVGVGCAIAAVPRNRLGTAR